MNTPAATASDSRRALGLELVGVKGWHQCLHRVPRALLRLYLAFSALFPNTRDSGSMIARKPDEWAPKHELDDKEMLEPTGLTCWDELVH